MEKKHTVKGIKKPKDEISQEKKTQIISVMKRNVTLDPADILKTHKNPAS